VRTLDREVAVRTVLRSRLAVGVVTCVATVFVVGAAAFAIIPDSNGVIHSCRNKDTGVLRVINWPAQRCRSWEVPLNWNQSGPQGQSGGLSGVAEFQTTQTWTAPIGTSRVMVEAWGGGGGGGTYAGSTCSGGGGGAGAYVRTVVPVTPGETYQLTVGVGGAIGAGGGGTTFGLSGQPVLMSAGGGDAGGSASGSTAGTGGTGGDAFSGFGGVLRDGADGSTNTFCYFAPGGLGTVGSIGSPGTWPQYPSPQFGVGGIGGTLSGGIETFSTPGNSGFALLTW
jgi:glycine rich protein